MPYIKQQDRIGYKEPIKNILEELEKSNNHPGHLNYIVSTIIFELFCRDQSYSNANKLVGVVECVKQEFYRRAVANMEDVKIIENGDITEFLDW